MKVKSFFVAMVALGVSTSVLADTAGESFTWKGYVPEMPPTSGNYVIKNTGSIDFNDGVLTIKYDAANSNYVISTLGDIKFSVVDKGDDSKVSDKFGAELSSFKLTNGGNVTDAPTSVNVKINDKNVGSFVTGVDSEDINIIKVDGTLTGLSPNSLVALQATILLKDISI